MITFDEYRSKGELDIEQFRKVKNYNFTRDDYKKALRYSFYAGKKMNLRCNPDEKDVEMIARLIGSLKDEVPKSQGTSEPHLLWLLTESYLLQGKSISPLFKAVSKTNYILKNNQPLFFLP